jgi:NhaA family Na+:H+ antiporter
VLQRPIDPARDHVRGGNKSSGVISVVVYGDYLSPCCRRLRLVIARQRRDRGGV